MKLAKFAQIPLNPRANSTPTKFAQIPLSPLVNAALTVRQDNLRTWQRERLAEHQQQRRSGLISVKSAQLLWTRESNGVLVIEADNYWAQVLPLEGFKIGYMVYEKDSGRTASYQQGYDHERQAIDAAEDYIQHGDSPKPERLPLK